jgi:hypothetical protein
MLKCNYNNNLLGGKIMATIGNNLSVHNAELRDNFLETEESKHLKQLIAKIKDGESIPNLFNVLSIYQVSRLTHKIKSQLKNYLVKYNKSAVRDFLESKDIDIDFIYQLYYIDGNIKRIYSESIIECIEEGLFDDKVMPHAENFLGIVLGSIEDLHMVMELER